MVLSSSVTGVANPIGGTEDKTIHVSSTADFSHTMKPTAVLVQDSLGAWVTPESLGYTLSFGSGMISPNAAVPEPSSLIMLAAGTLSLLGYSWNRSRRAQA